ncbi:hypothetical protein DBR42_27995 [Pelomonas sp. HMWF004]|nr:hypothetical protein DBR42_27995 [Pelomonas sp. HMWF004]
MTRKTLLALAAFTLTAAAQAATYNVAGSFDSAPGTTVLTGEFSFNDAGLPADFDGTLDLTALSISFMGQTYTLAQATDSYVQFEMGALTGPNASFTVPGGILALQSFFGASNFTYAANGGDLGGTLSFSIANSVPEPGTWALLLGGLAAVGAARRRRG